MATQPPYFILVSQSDLNSSTQSQPPISTTLSHPTVQYHYQDDSPSLLFPRSPDEQVLLLHYDPTRPSPQPIAKSISPGVAVTGVKVADAPGAAAEGGENVSNDEMFILETTIAGEDRTNIQVSQLDLRNPQAILARFKQRNAVLRRVLEYPNTNGVSNASGSPDPSTVTPRPS